MLGFDLSEREKGKMSSTWLKLDLFVFDLSVVKISHAKSSSGREIKKGSTFRLTRSST